MSSITQVSYSTSPLMSDPPMPMQDAVISTLLTGGSISKAIMFSNLTDFNSKMNKFYNFGRDEFVYGLPTGTIQATDIDESNVVEALTTLRPSEGTKTFLSSIYTREIANDLAVEYCQLNYDYDSDTGIVNSPPFSHDRTVYFDSGDINGTTLTITFVHEVYKYVIVGRNRYGYQYGWRWENEHEVISIPNHPTLMHGDIWFYVTQYQIDSNPADIRIWVYAPNSNAYPDMVTLSGEVTSSYYPIVPLIKGTKSIIYQDSFPQIEKDSITDILSILDFNPEEITDQVDANPERDKVADAFVHFGINIRTEVPESLGYLHDFFSYLSSIDQYSEIDFLNWKAITELNNSNGQPSTMPAVNLSYLENGQFHNELQYYYIKRDLVSGSIGKVGFAKKEYIQKPSFYMDVRKVDSSGRTRTYNRNIQLDEIIFYKQISLTTYSKITVVGLRHFTEPKKYYIHEVLLRNALSDGNSGFTIPLNKAILDIQPFSNVTRIAYDALALSVYVVVKVDLKWYETMAFRAIFLAIALVYTVFTFDPSVLYSWTAAAAFAFKIIAFQYLVELLIKEIGLENALILAAIIAIVTGSYEVFGSQGSLVFAEELMMAVTATVRAANKLISAETKLLGEEFEEFIKSKEEKEEELQNAYDLLDTSGVNPFDIIRGVPVFNINETPDDYYTRTIHTTNPGVMSLDMIGNYVSNSLKLPVYGESHEFIV